MSQYSYRIAARTEAAGKYDPSAPREGNEDSLTIIPDVGNPEASLSSDMVLPLPEKGTLMVVADGMGGHNAGEVASQIAVETVREMFSADKIADKQFDTPKSRANYLEDIVVAADKNIRKDAGANPERQGMGSTIVMVWIVGNELTVTWCGDSRAYRYRPGGKLEMLSEDHSLVQDMVRQKRISYEDTFSHPQGNVITRCLGGGSKNNAEPESRQFTLEVGDIVMLCSDGLSGVVFDYDKEKADGEPYSAENLQDILSRPKESLRDTLSCLFDAARRCDWYDNVTAILFELRGEGSEGLIPSDKQEHGPGDNDVVWNKKKKVNWKVVMAGCIVITLLILLFIFKPYGSSSGISDTTTCDDSMNESVEVQSDSASLNSEEPVSGIEDKGGNRRNQQKPQTKDTTKLAIPENDGNVLTPSNDTENN